MGIHMTGIMSMHPQTVSGSLLSAAVYTPPHVPGAGWCRLPRAFASILKAVTNHLSPQARRILDILREMARDNAGDSVATSWDEIMRAAQVGRSFVAGAIRELKATSAIEQVSGPGERARYRLRPPERTSANQCEPVRTGSLSESDSGSESELIDDDERCAIKNEIAGKVDRLLTEFMVAEPIRSQLAAQLLPMLAREPARETEIRTICERTNRETVWRNKPGVIVRRLRAFAAGQQDPLPVFASAIQDQPGKPTGKAAGAQGRAPRRRAGGLIRRQQVADSTPAEREAAAERARQRIAERAARRNKEATT